MGTKIGLIKLVARNMDSLIIDSTLSVAGTQNFFQDTNLQFQQSQNLVGRYMYAYGTPTHTAFSRLITVYGTPTAQIAPSWGTNSFPTLNQSYMIFDQYKAEDLQDVAARAIRVAGKHFFSRAYATFQVVATQYEYDVPSGFEYISGMHFIPSSGILDHGLLAQYKIKRSAWVIENNKIVFNPDAVDLGDYDDDFIRIIGQAVPSDLPNDHSTYDDDMEDYLVSWCTEQLAMRRMSGKENDPWRFKWQAARANRKEAEDSATIAIDADSVKVS